ncbi:UDP-glucuronosyltransferase 2C1-like [Periophthalmus magnuspinnatus]|uniref:UDP-glucuronosyltransferase 2C1-like n=1 Tax=Periophthalmus magnuspinnatus TaxID=409849 RepID=UPI00145A2E05|nr:UDP-glucuronosyltransferase 2C1-like [Periophthalmus magnuspinnatus]
MKLSCFCSAMLLFLLTRLRDCDGGNILVFPIEGSHWVNMDVMIKALHSRGHNITIIRSSQSWYIKESSSYYKTITVPVEGSMNNKEFITNIIKSVMDYERGALPLMNFLHSTVGMFSTFTAFHENVCKFVAAILDNEGLIKNMRASNFDLMLTDPCWGGGVILGKYLNLPLVYNVRWLITGDAHFALAPSPISYIPITGTGFTDKMTFLQRVKNVILHVITQMQYSLVVAKTYQPLCEKYFGPSINFNNLVVDADIWLMRADFVFEFPRPTMPNMVYMGGFQCKPAQPLPQHLEDFIQSSGDHGVILMSMGTFVNELPHDLTDDIAAAFAKLPQKVIWKHKGYRPASLGNNTLLVDWMPQNDILGHPKTRLFVAHGGTNGVQEAMYHGVPVVGVPAFFDQYDNLLRLQARGGAKILTLSTVNKNSFLSDIQEVLSDQSYRENMQRLSRLHRDQPIEPLNRAIFWIEFVMRHKGAAHLKSNSYKMEWYFYHSIDVACFLAGILALVLVTTVMLIRCLLYVLFSNKAKQD